MQFIDYYKKLFLNPEPIQSFGQYSTSTAALVLLLAILSWILALLLFQAMASNRKDIGELIAVRVGWGWATGILGALLLVDVIVLWILGRVVSWSAVSPHLTTAALGGFVTLLVYLGSIGELKGSQRALARAQKAG
jgi:hypothetical protein